MGCSSSTIRNTLHPIIFDQSHYEIENHIDDFYGLLVTGFIHRQNTASLSFNNILLCLRYYREKDLIVKENTSKTLISTNANVYYLFNSVKLEQNSKLTVSEWNKDTDSGGFLYIICNQIALESNSHIDLNGKGYSGGAEGGYCGYSHEGFSRRTHQKNFGGGGGVYVQIENPAAGGGGYGTKGISGKNKGVPNAEGGDLYSKEGLHLGSGGGSCSPKDKYGNGGAGGGGLRIQCFGKMYLFLNTAITCNGSKGDSVNCGSGSGGTICLILKNWSDLLVGPRQFIAHALGGKYPTANNENQGNGGDGKIRIFVENADWSEYELFWVFGHGQFSPTPIISPGRSNYY